MTGSRLACLLVMLALLFSCVEELSPEQRVQLARNDNLPLYFSGGAFAPMPATEKIGRVSGSTCKTSMIQSSASEEEALKNLWGDATSKKATAVVNVSCSPIDFLVPQVHCWPGIYCSGDAVK